MKVEDEHACEWKEELVLEMLEAQACRMILKIDVRQAQMPSILAESECECKLEALKHQP